MMKHDNELTRKIQLKELEILKVFQEICKRHNLRYFAIGGTCLGAVRHKGFIPWDDDVDVAMPYEDYMKLLELAKTELPENYKTYDAYSEKGCLWNHLYKIHDINTALIEGPCIKESHADRYWGIFIDVFPVCGVPATQKEFDSFMKAKRFYDKWNRKLRNNLRFRKTLRSLIAYPCCELFILFNPFYYFTRKAADLALKYPVGCSDKILFVDRPEKPNKYGWYKNIFMYEDFKNVIEVPFENMSINIPAGYDRYLTMDFGDYMTLPPEEQRLTHSEWFGGGIVDFERSYKYYAALKRAGKPLC